MLSNSQLKYIKSLSIKKFRLKHKSFICEGDKIVKELLENQSFDVELLCALPEWIQHNRPLWNLPADRLVQLSERDLKKISNLKTPNQVLAVVKIPHFEIEPAVASSLCLFLDDIRDPGNMGTILRIADWFGLPYVFASPNSVDFYNPKVVQSSMGAFLRVKSILCDLSDIIRRFPEKKIYGAHLEGHNLFTHPLDKTGLVVIGNEGKGISDANSPMVQEWLSIPSGGGAESLNAAVATGIICACFRNL
jgi:TrmH family RNA methyltransferase